MADTNPNIHSNPDAMAWAKEFGKYESNPPEDVMLGWFANAMMAMHDHIYQNNTVTPR